MSRRLKSEARAEAESQFHTLILMGKFDFDDPVYAHSGIGQLTYDGNTYVGVGEFGSIGESRESENVGPLSMNISLAAPNASYLLEAMDAGRYGDDITIYAGYRKSDGTLATDPWVVWSGWYEFASVNAGGDNTINITAQHDLSVLEEIDGSRFTDEEWQRKFPGDKGFEFVHEQATKKLLWGGSSLRVTVRPTEPNPGPGYEVP